jgi:ubiquinone/menaquinone biosynthesis C-methylase UbiE
MAIPPESRNLSFGGVVDAYEKGRPDYPADAVQWLVGDGPLSVLELGAGTGKLTEALVAAGHDVHATDPDATMLDRLADKLPELRISQAAAEEIPATDASYDVVVAAQAYHWFDHEVALPEIARVLKRGGYLALVWNVRDERIPWVKKLGRILGEEVHDGSPGKELDTSRYFGPIEERTFKHWQVVDKLSIQDLTLSRSHTAMLEEPERQAKLAEVLAFYDDYGRGMDGMQLPYVTRCFRAKLGIRPEPKHPAGPVADEQAEEDAKPEITAERPPVEPPTDDDSGVLLIDFH